MATATVLLTAWTNQTRKLVQGHSREVGRVFLLLIMMGKMKRCDDEYEEMMHTVSTLTHSHYYTLFSLKMTCPQQPLLQLPVSRIHDGICDCCDGADEITTKCPNVCDEVLREERARRAQLEQNFKQGSVQRLAVLHEFQNMLVESQEEMDQITFNDKRVQQEIVQLDTRIQTLKLEALHQRRTLVDAFMASASPQALLKPLSHEELKLAIVQTCQLAGEQQDSHDDSSTCVPLRLAGLNLGIEWVDESQTPPKATLNRLELDTWANLVDRNANGNVVWSSSDIDNGSSSGDGRRRLTELDSEEDDFEDDYDYPHDDDDDLYDEHDYDDEDYHRHYVPPKKKEIERNPELYDEIKSYAFSASRVSFLKRASDIIEKIDALMKETDDEEDEEKEKETSTSNVDPMAFQMVRSTLRRREQSIQRGLDYAVSANILLAQVDEKDLLALAAGTLYYSKISSTDFYQIITYMKAEVPKESCVSPWSILCPPQAMNRDGTKYPPVDIIKAAEKLCQEQEVDTEAVCGTSDEDIPSTISNGYYGYFEVQPRDEQDALSQLFAPLEKLDGDRSQLTELISQKDELEKEQRTLKNRLKELEEQMGGRDHSKYGNQGELYSLRDTCHSVQAGKYIYEVCIFGRAAQKEGEKSSGTSLGQWKGIKVDPETGDRIMEWTNGQKCWNGPNRSATVVVTCGAENKVLRAEEPDTCRYVLEMESYIACDEDYKQRHGL